MNCKLCALNKQNGIKRKCNRKFYIFSFGPQSTDIGKLLSALSNQIISTEELHKIAQLIDCNKEYFKKSEKSVQSAFETIMFNIQWIGRNVQDMKSRLEDRLSLMGLLKDIATE